MVGADGAVSAVGTLPTTVLNGMSALRQQRPMGQHTGGVTFTYAYSAT